METSRTLEQMNEAQKKTILELSQKLQAANKRIAELTLWETFVAHLINEREGEVITEANMQTWMQALQK